MSTHSCRLDLSIRRQICWASLALFRLCGDIRRGLQLMLSDCKEDEKRNRSEARSSTRVMLSKTLAGFYLELDSSVCRRFFG